MRHLALALVLALAGCKTQQVAGECPDNSKIPCATNRSCSEDKARGCMVCTCDPALSPAQQGQESPSDRAMPEG